jgi:phosphohistidine swiveling domain-containing protein
VLGLDDFITDEWYPGFVPSFGHSPYIVEPFRSFSAADADRFWFLDFHWARGLTPLGMIWNEDGYSWGTQYAAEQMPLPSGRGMTQRIAGTHTYAAVIPVRNKLLVAARDKRMRAYLPGFLNDFDNIWAQRRAEIETGWQALLSRDVSSLSDAELAVMLRDARSYYRRLFEIHFEMMYPLIANYLGFRGVCRELGIETETVAKFLQGYETKISLTDRALWALAADARSCGVEAIFGTYASTELMKALQTDPGGRRWLRKLSGFLDEYGHRTAGTADVALPSWAEDPMPVLSTVAEFLLQKPHDFDTAHAAAVEHREAAIDEARGKLARREQQVFDAGLDSVQRANFPWWQDDHNFYIDLRVSLPVRWAALELARRLGTDRFDDTMFLFWPELVELADKERNYGAELRAIVEARRQYFDYWHSRRPEMPRVLGKVPDVIDDPLLIEIYGLDRGYMDAVRAQASGTRLTTLKGIPAARGSARGRARVLRDAGDLDKLRPGEILVCESTSASWTLAFGVIAGCVCDSGGTLSHAAIVGREYGVPTVTACGVATSAISDGDQIHVDGDTGTVTIVGEQ